ncbi:YcaO-like family protein [Yoonia sp. 2307UL14-13]|uniref:YcaO-like family protein n=1 Tax=Yoonia sp. 2307UL14-13 TaxID=3126506 RepID=UPI0040403844
MVIAVSSIKLSKGCAAPDGASHRVAAGAGLTPEIAAFHAMCEAAERYALQFQEGRTGSVDPIRTVGGDPTPWMIETLCLGHPEHPVDSKGCATGESLADATDRAALELIENLLVPDIVSSAPDTVNVDPVTIPMLAPLVDYLRARLRHITLEVLTSPLGFCVCRVILADPDGGRPTFGRAAGLDIVDAVLKAAHEAVLSWRNMIELERNGVPLNDPDPLVAAYRGVTKVAPPDAVVLSDMPELPAATMSPLEMLAETVSRPAHAFDMSVPEIAMPVVRVVV